MGGGAAPRHKGGRRVTRKSASPGLWRGTGAQTQWAALYESIHSRGQEL